MHGPGLWKVTTCGMHATLLATERFMTKPPAEPEPREHHLHNDIPGQTTAPLSSPALIITSIIITSIIITSDQRQHPLRIEWGAASKQRQMGGSTVVRPLCADEFRGSYGGCGGLHLS